MNKIIIAGSRTFNDYEFFMGEVSSYIIEKNHHNYEIISGMASGTDSLAIRYAKEFNIPLLTFPADWIRYGNRAGYLRNVQMSEAATHLLAFWDGKSKGTAMMIRIAREKQLHIEIIKIKPS